MSSSSPSTAITTRANARIGLMGNPSDGFNGKTISFLIKNFEASVTVVPSPSLVLQPHLDHDTNEYATLKHLYNETGEMGSCSLGRRVSEPRLGQDVLQPRLAFVTRLV